MSAVGRVYGKVKAALGHRRPLANSPQTQPDDLKAAYVSWTEHCKQHLPYDRAMEEAIGGYFEPIGRIEAALIQHYGLARDGYLVDVGCGSGRLAKPLSAYLLGPYLGFDLVPDLIAYAKQLVGRPDWRFEVIDHIEIPEADGRAP